MGKAVAKKEIGAKQAQLYAALAGYTVTRLYANSYRLTDADGKALNNYNYASVAWRDGYHILQHRLKTIGRP